MSESFCAFCREPVNPTKRGNYRKVEGWVEVRSQGGAHAISERKELQEYACGACMRARRMGFDRTQGKMF